MKCTTESAKQSVAAEDVAEHPHLPGVPPPPRVLEEGLEVRVCPDEQATHRASRAVGIDEENDGRRARCVGKRGTILALDQEDQTAKVRVIVGPRHADELWFGIAALEPVGQKQ